MEATVKKYKYKIQALLNEVPGPMTEKQQKLADAIGISYDRMSRYRLAHSTHTLALNSDQLAAAAEVLSEMLDRELIVDDLMNVPRQLTAEAA